MGIESKRQPQLARGRGARSNRTGRFESHQVEAFDDGWGEDREPRQIATSVLPMAARTIIAHNDSPDIGFSRSINPYRGCSHGCIYCYARPAHTYLGLSAGLDFETKIFYKTDAAAVLERELSKSTYKPAVIHIGGDTDPYQPDEKDLRVTRSVLEVFQRYRHPFSIITKSTLILRDIEIYQDMAARGLVRVAVSITSLDRKLARAMEPRCATPERRIEAVRALTGAGVPVVVLFAPCIPGLNDHEMDQVLQRSAEAGAVSAAYVALRLPLEIKDLFEEWLGSHYPDRAARVMSLIRQMRGGAAYQTEFGTRMKGTGPIAELMSQRFAMARQRYGLGDALPELDLRQFRVPPRAGEQLQLFGQ